jgi:hypothetical protein
VVGTLGIGEKEVGAVDGDEEEGVDGLEVEVERRGV